MKRSRLKLSGPKTRNYINYENKSIELTQIKNEIESIKKDKNVLSVALKEVEKAFAKEREVFEDKIRDLNEYKNRQAGAEL